jgi:hypothetical protein
LITAFRLFLIITISLWIRVEGLASPSEGVYIETKGSVVFFSDDYLIVNPKSEDKMIFSPSKKSVKKEVKTSSLNKKQNVQRCNVKIANIEEKKIPLKHLLFNVKNTKKRELSLIQSKDTHVIFFMAMVLDPFLSANGMTYLGSDFVYSIQNQWIKLILYSSPYDISSIFTQFAFLGLFLHIFFYLKVSKKAKNFVYLLKRGPPFR